MTGFVLPDSWLSLSRTVKYLVSQRKRPQNARTEADSVAILNPPTQEMSSASATTLQDLQAPITIQPSEPPTNILASAVKPNPGSPKPYAVDLRESVFTSVFSISGKKSRASEVLKQEPLAEVSLASEEAQSLHVLVVSEDLEEMERDLSTLSSLTTVPNAAAALAAGFKLNEKAQLQIIKGIGPKTIQMLNAAQINTFSDLADYCVSDLRKILQAAGPYHRLAKPASWISQANLASLNRWETLKALQASGPTRRRSKLGAALKSVELNP